jgi:hypothetical protein
MRWRLRLRRPENKGAELSNIGIWETWYDYGQNGTGTVTVIAPDAVAAIEAVKADNPDENRRVYSVKELNARVIVYEAPKPEST